MRMNHRCEIPRAIGFARGSPSDVKSELRRVVVETSGAEGAIRYLPTRRHSRCEEVHGGRRGEEGEILAFVREIATQILSANSSERPGIAPEETPEYG